VAGDPVNEADPVQYRQIVCILLSNAIRHTGRFDSSRAGLPTTAQRWIV
jgi:signal transduction histidine kinase